MTYKGRVSGSIFVIAIIVMIKIIVAYPIRELPFYFPIFALIPITIGWFLGKEYDKAIYKANRDLLTGLYNRRYLIERIEYAFKQTTKQNGKLAIILLDINDFKAINDRFGHKRGDEMLVCISELLLESFSSNDIIARWGGDEFLIVSPFSDQQLLDNKIRRFKHVMKEKSCKYNGLSVSIGTSYYPVDDQNFEQLISKADNQMYQFKSRYKKTAPSF